jgi:phosphonate transport system ATP-binding protein
MSTITVRAAAKRFSDGCLALDGVDLMIQDGSFTVILGPSGSGKSTLLRLMNGLETPSSGQIFVGQRPVIPKNLVKIRCEVAMVFQRFNLVDRLSVMTNVLTGRLGRRSWTGTMFHLFRAEDMAIAAKALDRVSLTERAWCRVDKLSGGQQQRVGIARALAQQPKAILADEPVASLDPVTGEEIMVLLREICDQDGITVVVNLHQVELARRFADRVIGLNSGRIVFDGSPAQMTPQALETIYQRGGDDAAAKREMALALA